MPLPSWDVFIGIVFLLGIGYGFILRREKTITTLCASYIALVIATNFSQTIFDFFNGNKMLVNQLWVRSNAPLSTITIIIFLLSIFLISGAINSSMNKAGEISPIEVAVYSALNVAFIISSVLFFFSPEVRLHIIQSSRAANILYNFHTFIVLAPPVSFIILNIRGRSK